MFRATKRRKTAAKSIHQPTTNKNSSSGSEDNQPAGPLVRPRGQVKVKSRVGGITFTNTRSLEIGAADDESTAMIVRGTATNSASKEANTKTNGLANRFIGSGMGAGIGRDTIENDENVYVHYIHFALLQSLFIPQSRLELYIRPIDTISTDHSVSSPFIQVKLERH